MAGAERLAHGIPAGLTPPEGRRFGLTVGAAFLVLAAIMRWRGYEIPLTIFGVLGVGLVLAGAAIPGRLGPLYRAWMGLALMISRVTTPLFMGIVFFVVITPIGLAMRLLGRNPIRHAAVGGSYWADRSDARGGMTNQF